MYVKVKKKKENAYVFSRLNAEGVYLKLGLDDSADKETMKRHPGR